ncbi:MAG: GNAT family N-acetyltransferase [Pseudomonadota bacterium]
MVVTPAWRQMRQGDLAEVLGVANAVHPELPESQAVFAERLSLFPRGCLVLSGHGGIAGYAVSHPIRRFQPPALDTMLGTLPVGADDYYIHDFVVAPMHRGSGQAAVGVELLLATAREYETTSLISVYGTAGFWGRFGFAAAGESMREKLLPYGANAIYMIRRRRILP